MTKTLAPHLAPHLGPTPWAPHIGLTLGPTPGDRAIAITGDPGLQVPAKHLARVVLAMVAELDVSAAEARYSSLGRHGYAPRRLLAVWVYASMVGMRYASVLARALKTDAALRLLAGGYENSPQTLRRFRQHCR